MSFRKNASTAGLAGIIGIAQHLHALRLGHFFDSPVQQLNAAARRHRGNVLAWGGEVGG